MQTIFLISKTSIDWNVYLLITKDVLGFSVTRHLDDRNEKVENLRGFIETLKTFSLGILDHASLGYLVFGTKEFFFRVMQHQGIVPISVTETNNPDLYMGIMTGTLFQLREFVLRCSDGDETPDVRRFANELQYEIEKEYKLFSGFSRRGNHDGTYKLLPWKP